MACLCRVVSSWAFGWVFFGFTGFSWFVLLLFLSISGVFWDLFLCRAASALSLWVVLLSDKLSSLLLCFFASLLLCFCFFASPLLCFYLLIALLILCAVFYSFAISYLNLRFSSF